MLTDLKENCTVGSVMTYGLIWHKRGHKYKGDQTSKRPPWITAHSPRTQGQLVIIWGPVEGLVETLARIVKEQTQHQRMRVMAKSLILLWSIYQKAVNLLDKFTHCFALPAVTDGNFQTAIKWLTNKNTTRWTLEQKPGRKFSRVKKAFLHAEGQRGGWYRNSRETK